LFEGNVPNVEQWVYQEAIPFHEKKGVSQFLRAAKTRMLMNQGDKEATNVTKKSWFSDEEFVLTNVK